MKSEELRKILIEEKYLKIWTSCTYRTSPRWTWNIDGSIDVDGDIETKRLSR